MDPASHTAEVIAGGAAVTTGILAFIAHIELIDALHVVQLVAGIVAICTGVLAGIFYIQRINKGA